jgi:hypothetical protein
MKISIAKYTKNLYASEVYRELERQAVRKGHFDLTPEEQVKLAAQEVDQHQKINTPVSAEPTEDLVQDVARLAFAMRRKGFISQAEELEDKLVIFKQAECALYNVTNETNQDFIDMAHPDGDFQVDGFGELGVVETVESAAAKIRAVTEKNPTGKIASLSDIANLIKSAQDMLGEDGAAEVATTTESTEGGTVDAATKSSVDQIKEQLKQISESFKQIQSINFDDAITTFLHGQPGKSSAFNTLGGNYQALNTYGAMYKAAYGQGQPTAQTIQNTLINNPQGANTYLQGIGVQERVAKQIRDSLVKEAQYYGYNPAEQVVQQEVQKATERVSQQAQQIAYSVDTKIKQKQQLAQAEVDKVIAKLNEIKTQAARVTNSLDQMAGWSTDTLRDVRNFYIRVKNSIGQIQGELANTQWLLIGFGHSEAVQKISQGIELLKGSLENLSKSIQHVSGANIPDTHGRLSEIRRIINGMIEKEPDPKRPSANLARTLNMVNSMISSIRSNQTKGERAVLDAIKGGYKTWQEFDNDTMQLLEMVKRDAGGR